MTDQIQNTKETVLVALDIAKKTHEALIQLPNGKRLSMKVQNTLVGYKLLFKRCGYGTYRVVCGFEPTADYHRNIGFWLLSKGCECKLVSSLSCA